MTNYLIMTSLVVAILTLSLTIVLICEMRALVKCGSCWLESYSDWKKELGIDDTSTHLNDEVLKKVEEEGMYIQVSEPEIIAETIHPISQDKEVVKIFNRMEAARYLNIKYWQIPASLQSHKRKGKLYYYKHDLDNYVEDLSRTKMTFNNTKTIFNRIEAAAYLGISYSFISRIPRNTLPFYKKVRKSFYTKKDLDLYKKIYPINEPTISKETVNA